MPDLCEFNVEGQRLAALPINPGASGEPVILLHGITASVYTWQVNPWPVILEQGPCYALSLPGHYPAQFPPGFRREQLTAEMMARVLTATIRQLAGDRPVTLIGHSTGGFAALDIAAHTPEIAARVVSIAGFARGRCAQRRDRPYSRRGSHALYGAGRRLSARPGRLVTQDTLVEGML